MPFNDASVFMLLFFFCFVNWSLCACLLDGHNRVSLGAACSGMGEGTRSQLAEFMWEIRQSRHNFQDTRHDILPWNTEFRGLCEKSSLDVNTNSCASKARMNKIAPSADFLLQLVPGKQHGSTAGSSLTAMPLLFISRKPCMSPLSGMGNTDMIFS